MKFPFAVVTSTNIKNGYLFIRQEDIHTEAFVWVSCLFACLFGCTFHELNPLFCSELQLTSETTGILVGLLGREISPSQGLSIYTRQHNTEKRRYTSMSRAGFQSTFLVFDKTKITYPLDGAATGTSSLRSYLSNLPKPVCWVDIFCVTTTRNQNPEGLTAVKASKLDFLRLGSVWATACNCLRQPCQSLFK
jgi:hypothetical protein